MSVNWYLGTLVESWRLWGISISNRKTCKRWFIGASESVVEYCTMCGKPTDFTIDEMCLDCSEIA